MVLSKQSIRAMNNFDRLSHKAYTGRGLVCGLTNDGKLAIVYWIGGRSDPSKNRVLEYKNGIIATKVADPSKPSGDPELTIYNAVREFDGTQVVSNGHQTDSIIELMREDDPGSFGEALVGWEYEPDANFTPRITAILNPRSKRVNIAIIKKSRLNKESDRHFYAYSLAPGFGYCITTYLDGSKDENDLLRPFEGEPLLVSLDYVNAADIAENYFINLNEETRVSVAAKVVRCAHENSICLYIHFFD